MTRRARLLDALLALALSALSVVLLAPMRAIPWYAIPVALAYTLPLAARRAAPVPATSAAFVAAFAYVVLGLPLVGLGPTGLVWLYSAGSHVAPPVSYGFLAAAQAAVAVAIGVGGQGDAATWVGDAIALGAAFGMGDSNRRRRELQAEQRERAARRAVAEERLRIARELHDVVAHSMSVIAVQAGTGRLVVDSEPARAREALAVIERTSRDALDEMRRLLGVLRSDDAAGRAPAPGLDGVDELVALTVASGVPVTVRVEGERRTYAGGLELAAYRILQEALTNVARHAPGTAATVVLRHGDGSLGIEVTNGPGGPAPASGGSGHGLLGVRERAAVYGGTVTAEPLPGGGFRLATTLEAR